MISYEEYQNNRTNIGYLTADPELDNTIHVSGNGACYDLEYEFGTSDFEYEYDYYRDEMTITVEKQLDEDARENEYDETETVELDELEYENLFNKLKGELYYNDELFEDCGDNFVSVSHGEVTTEIISDPKYLTVHGEFKCGVMPFEFEAQNAWVPSISFTNINGEHCPAPFFVADSCDLLLAIEEEYEAHDLGLSAEREDDKIHLDFSIGSNLKQDFEGVCTIHANPVYIEDLNTPEVKVLHHFEYFPTLEVNALEDGVFAESGKVDMDVFKPDVRDAIWDTIEKLAPEISKSERETEMTLDDIINVCGDIDSEYIWHRLDEIDPDVSQKIVESFCENEPDFENWLYRNYQEVLNDADDAYQAGNEYDGAFSDIITVDDDGAFFDVYPDEAMHGYIDEHFDSFLPYASTTLLDELGVEETVARSEWKAEKENDKDKEKLEVSRDDEER